MNGTQERIQFVIGSKAAAAAIFASFSYRWKDMTTDLSVTGEARANPRDGGLLGANKAFAYARGGSFTCFR
jgi:hypothetical protein